MDSNMTIEDVGRAVLQELWNKVAIQATELARETKNSGFERDCFKEFSRNMLELSNILKAREARSVDSTYDSQVAKAALETLSLQLKKANEIVREYKSGSRLRLLLKSNSLLAEMRNLARDIATTISRFQLINLGVALSLKTRTEQVMNNLRAMEFRSAVATDEIAAEIEKSMSQNGGNRENALQLLEKIAAAVGADASRSTVQNELALLKKEKEEMEDRKKQAEALQAAQLIQLLHDTEIIQRPREEDVATSQHCLINSFICPLSNEVMADPVAVACGHSFERKAIQDHFDRGKTNCPTCGLELTSVELTPNVNVRHSIEDRKQKDMDFKFLTAVGGIKSNDCSRQNNALNDIYLLLQIPHYVVKLAEEGIVQKLAAFLKDKRSNKAHILNCLLLLAKDDDRHKEAIAEVGVVRRIVKLICNGEERSDALAVLLELSKKETIAEIIGANKDSIPILVSLINNEDSVISQKAENVLLNLSSNTSFTVKMAEAGYFKPFVIRFNQGPQESRALMAADLSEMQLKENNINDLKDKHFIRNLIQMLNSSSPAYKVACLKCVKKLIAYSGIIKQLLSDPVTIPSLLTSISFVRCDPHLREDAVEILALLVEACNDPEFEMYQPLQELQSEHNVRLFLQFATSSDPQSNIQFLHLLVVLCGKSEMTRSFIRADNDAMPNLFSLLRNDHHEIRRWVMKLIYCISDAHPGGVPIPPSLEKEAFVNALASTFISSKDIEERSLAAGIISLLPKDDTVIDEILQKSEVLSTIREVINSLEDENNRTKAPIIVDTSLLENALSLLLRFTEPAKSELQRQLGKLELYPSLVRVLSRGSPLAKKRTAVALAQLSHSTGEATCDATLKEAKGPGSFFQAINWCCSSTAETENLCKVHGSACLAKHALCLIKAEAVKPLVQVLNETEPGVAEAALTALETLLTNHSAMNHATAEIVDKQGVEAILQILEKGDLSTKEKALDVFQKILKHTKISDPIFQRSERILIQLLQEDVLKKKVALVLKQMKILPDQSSYF